MSQYVNFYLKVKGEEIFLTQYQIHTPQGEAFRKCAPHGKSKEITMDYLTEICNDLLRQEAEIRRLREEYKEKFKLYCKIPSDASYEEKMDEINIYTEQIACYNGDIENFKVAYQFCDFLKTILEQQEYEENPATLVCGVEYWPQEKESPQ